MHYQPTSREAWREFLPVSAALDRRIMEVIDHAGKDGICCADIELCLNRSHQSVSGNLRHLVERGLVEKSGLFGRTPSGRKAIKWRVRVVAPPQRQLQFMEG